MKPLTETVTVIREAPQEIADLVGFVRYCAENDLSSLSSDAELVTAARAYWDRQHGED